MNFFLLYYGTEIINHLVFCNCENSPPTLVGGGGGVNELAVHSANCVSTPLFSSRNKHAAHLRTEVRKFSLYATNL